MIDVGHFVSSIPVLGGVLKVIGTVACHTADIAGSVTRDSLHTVGDHVYSVLQGFKGFVDSIFSCGGGTPPPAAPPAIPPVS